MYTTYRYDNVTLSLLLLPARVTNQSHSTYGSSYFMCTCLVLEISLFGIIIVKHRSNVFLIWHLIHAHHESICKVPWWTRFVKKQFSNTKSIVKVETGIVTLISYHHYLKIEGNNNLWPDMQKESWNIHLTKILICPIRWMGPIRNPNWSTSGMRVTLSYLH